MSINNHEWFDFNLTKVLNENSTAVCLDVSGIPCVAIASIDVIALAKHFKLTAEDINCPMLNSEVNINGQAHMVSEEVAEQFSKFIRRSKDREAILKAKQEELNESDVKHFDEVAELELKIKQLESELKLKRVN